MTDVEFRSPGRRFLSVVKEVLIILVGAILVSSLLRAFVFEPFEIPSGSMQNTMQVGDRVVAQKLTEFKRGDVIVFRDPGSWVDGGANERTDPIGKGLEFIGVLPNSSENFLTKRVIGTSGDTVTCCDGDGKITVNGYALDEGEYLYSDFRGPVAPSEMPFEVVVPEGHLFVLGDHRNASADSRCHLTDSFPGMADGDVAFVPVENVVGPVGLIVAPFDRWGQLLTPETFSAVPEPTEPAPSEARIIQSASC